MNYRDYAIFDTETTSANPLKTQPCSLACVMVHGRTLEIKPGSEFNSYINVITDQDECDRLELDKMQEGATKVHGLTEEFLSTAPSLKTVWSNFVDYTKEYNFRGTDFTAPVAVGYNIRNFDLPIVERICSKEPWNYGPKSEKFPRGNVLHPIYAIDVMDLMFTFFENSKEVNSLSADNLIRNFLGYSKGTAHDAMSDVIMVAELFCKTMRMIRGVCKNRKFKGSMT